MSLAIEGRLVKVCATGDVPLGEGRAITVGDRRVAVFHAASGWYALEDSCPHRGGPLSDGILADRCVACPLHDRRFDLATGSALSGGAAAIAHRVVLVGEAVHLDIVPSLERAA